MGNISHLLEDQPRRDIMIQERQSIRNSSMEISLWKDSSSSSGRKLGKIYRIAKLRSPLGTHNVTEVYLKTVTRTWPNTRDSDDLLTTTYRQASGRAIGRTIRIDLAKNLRPGGRRA